MDGNHETTVHTKGSRRREAPRRGVLGALVAISFTALLGATPGVYFTTCNLSGPQGSFELLPGGVGPSTLLFDGFTLLAGAVVRPTGLALDPVNERAYIGLMDAGPPDYGGIWSFGLDGTFLGVVLDPSDLGATQLDVIGVAIDVGAQQLYASVLGSTIVRVDLSTTTATTILSSLSNTAEVEVSSTSVYWTENSATPYGAVKRADLDGTNVQTLVTGLNGAKGLALDLAAAKMYFSDDDGLYRANLDGSSPEILLLSAFSVPVAIIDVDPGGSTLYWSDGTATIYASDLDATSYASIASTPFPSAGVRVLLPACRDGFDNDGDLAIDYPADTDCVSPLDPVEGKDSDGDDLADGFDNCPYEWNPTQSDVGGLGAAPPDGIGDACQCGDTNDSGTVTATDATVLQRAIVGLSPYYSVASGLGGGGPGLAKCNVGAVSPGVAGCTSSDAIVISRALVSLSPGIAQGCDAAQP